MLYYSIALKPIYIYITTNKLETCISSLWPVSRKQSCFSNLCPGSPWFINEVHILNNLAVIAISLLRLRIYIDKNVDWSFIVLYKWQLVTQYITTFKKTDDFFLLKSYLSCTVFGQKREIVPWELYSCFHSIVNLKITIHKSLNNVESKIK